jgi:protein phosphatase
LETTRAEIEALETEVREALIADTLAFLALQKPYLVLDSGAVVVAHAGIKAEMIGRYDEEVRHFTLYGDVTGEKDEDGYPVRRDWAQHYAGEALVVYGHTPQETVQFVNNTLNIDRGCVFGGELVALRYPEREIVTVPARKAYWER